jgi:hypothetical protein
MLLINALTGVAIACRPFGPKLRNFATRISDRLKLVGHQGHMR